MPFAAPSMLFGGLRKMISLRGRLIRANAHGVAERLRVSATAFEKTHELSWKSGEEGVASLPSGVRESTIEHSCSFPPRALSSSRVPWQTDQDRRDPSDDVKHRDDSRLASWVVAALDTDIAS